jgi:hypothetical protein
MTTINLNDLETIDGNLLYDLRVERDGARSYKAYSGAGDAVEMALEIVGDRVGVWYKTAGNALVFLADRFMLTAWQQVPENAVVTYSDNPAPCPWVC